MTKKDEILQAASDCFNFYGYSKASMSDIGKRVGMNKASLYYHFKDKLSLYEAVVDEMMKKHHINIRKSMEQFKTTDEMIIQFITMEIDFWSHMSVTYQLTLQDDTKSVVNKILSQNGILLGEIISKGIASGTYESCNVMERAQLLIQVGQGILELDCPLQMPMDQRQEGYETAKLKISKIVSLILKGMYAK